MTTMDATPTPQTFVADILTNRHNRAILAAWDALDLPDGWLVAKTVSRITTSSTSIRPICL